MGAPRRVDVTGLLDFAADAHRCEYPAIFRQRVLDELALTVPYDSALFLPIVVPDRGGTPRLMGKPASVNKDVIGVRIYFGHPDRYAGWAQRSATAAAHLRGAYRDYEVFSRHERDRLRFYADIVRPSGVRKQIVAHLRFRAFGNGVIHICRHDLTGFTPAELEKVRQALPAIAVAQAALAPEWTSADWAPVHPDPVLEDLRERMGRLAPRERQVAELVARGFQDSEVGALLGTSRHTVGNQVVRILEKMSATNRAELAALVQRVLDAEGPDHSAFAPSSRRS